jgi:hypothetical protein
MSPILPGLAVMCCRVRQRPVSRANPRSPRQRRERWRALRVRVLISRSCPPAGCLTAIQGPPWCGPGTVRPAHRLPAGAARPGPGRRDAARPGASRPDRISFTVVLRALTRVIGEPSSQRLLHEALDEIWGLLIGRRPRSKPRELKGTVAFAKACERYPPARVACKLTMRTPEGLITG